MTRAALAFVLCVTSSAMAGYGHGGGGHAMGGGHGPGPSGHGWHGHPGGGGGWHHHHHPGFVGTFIYDPWFWDPFFFPYAYPYYPAYVPPPDDEAPDEPAASSTEEDAGDPLEASYGLVQLRGVPEGASVELDGRYWLSAARLDERWLALPRGQHTITVRPDGGRVVERHVDVQPGTNAVVEFARGG